MSCRHHPAIPRTNGKCEVRGKSVGLRRYAIEHKLGNNIYLYIYIYYGLENNKRRIVASHRGGAAVATSLRQCRWEWSLKSERSTSMREPTIPVCFQSIQPGSYRISATTARRIQSLRAPCDGHTIPGIFRL